jgi:hypothetical protein
MVAGPGLRDGRVPDIVSNRSDSPASPGAPQQGAREEGRRQMSPGMRNGPDPRADGTPAPLRSRTEPARASLSRGGADHLSTATHLGRLAVWLRWDGAGTARDSALGARRGGTWGGLEGVEGVLTRCRRQGLESGIEHMFEHSAVNQQIGHQVSVVGWCRVARVGREWSWVVMSGLDVSEGDVSWCVGSVIPSMYGSVGWVRVGCVGDVVGGRVRSRALPPSDEGTEGIAARVLC